MNSRPRPAGKTTRSRWGAVAATVAIALALSAFGGTAAPAAEPPVSIDVLTTNDFHGRLEAFPPIAGAAVLGGMVDSYEAANPNTLFVGAGDLIGASTFTSFIQQDQPTIDALNAIGLDASGLGNHEFDQGTDDLRDRVIPAADWPYLSANVYNVGTQTPAFDEYWVAEFQGVTVGFVGAVTEELPSLVSPAGIADIEVGPIVPAVNRVADQLSDGVEANGEADVIMLLVHEGAATVNLASATDDSVFGRLVSGVNANVDAIVSAHTHLPYNHQIPVAGSSKVRPVLSAGQYGERYGHLNLSVDPATGDLLSITSEVLPLAGAFPPDPAVAQIVTDAVAVASVLGSVKVGDITADFNRAVQTNASENRGGESPLGNFVADVQLWATQDASAEIALMNPGGLRADLKYAPNPLVTGDAAGLVTFAEAAGVQPFANTLVAMDLTTEQLKSVLEQQWQPAGASRPFLKLGVSESLKYTYDPSGVAGDRIDAIYVDGALAQPGGSYRVTVNSFLASGGDNFGTLALGTNRADTGRVDLQSMVDYFEAFPVATPDYAQRAVGVILPPADADGYSAGDQLTLGLSSLLFSSGGPNAGTVSVALGGTVLGSATLDPAIVDTTDEGGRASVPITIPEDVTPGDRVLTVSVAATGTTIDVPIAITEPLEIMINLEEPFVSGPARVGSTLTATGGLWNAPSPAFTYQWERDGVPIDGASSRRYKIVAADAGADLTVVVTATSPGFEVGTAESSAKSVAKLATSITGSTGRLFQQADDVAFSVTVRAKGAVPTGPVNVYDGTRLVASAVLEPDDGGRAIIPVPGLGRGLHILTARFEGGDQFLPSTTSRHLVFVLR